MTQGLSRRARLGSCKFLMAWQIIIYAFGTCDHHSLSPNNSSQGLTFPISRAGMSASRRTSSSATTGKLSTLSSASTFMPSTVSGGDDDDDDPVGQILESPNLKIYTFAELKSATRNFRPETVLGEGGFGKVYKGWVDEKTMNPSKASTGVMVAVKKLNPESVQGMEQWQVPGTGTVRVAIFFVTLLIACDLWCGGSGRV
jgi:hypothetical protein